nr:isoform 2 of kinesin light chain [Quercus suber]
MLTIDATLARPETPPKPTSNVPYRRDPNFVKRATLTEHICAKLSEPAARVALVGLGGVGNVARFDESVHEIVDQLKIYGRNDPHADHLHLLYTWLRDGSKGSWLIVLDNADDAGFLVETPATSDANHPMKRRIDHLPACEHGAMVITSRSKSEALKMVYDDDIVEVLPMNEEEAVALLTSKLKQSSEDDRPLVRALECMPLAIIQAAAYIRARAPRCSVQQYRTEIERGRSSRTSLLRRHVPLPDRDRDACNSVLLTWQISFEHIYQVQRSAAELLSFISCCDRVAIPEALLQAYVDGNSGTTNASQMEEDIVLLRSFSFVSITYDSQVWEMHRLVQDALQMWLEDCNRLNDVLGQFVQCLDVLLPAGDFEDWVICRTLSPHARRMIEYKPVDSKIQLDWASVMYKCAYYMQVQGHYAEALVIASASVASYLEHLGGDSERTLSGTALVASIYHDQGLWNEAEILEEDILAKRRQTLGEDHPDTLMSMGDLASTYQNQGRWKEAEELEITVIAKRTSVLGEEHSDTLTSIGNLALTYWKQGRWKEAEDLEVNVLAKRSRVLGEDHPDTLTSMGNLASTYHNQGRWKDAEELEIMVIAKRTSVLGEEHPDTLTSIGNLASTYRSQGRWKEAEELEIMVVAKRARVLGEEHPYTLASMASLAYTYSNQGRWTEVEGLEVKVMETMKRVLGVMHPSTLASMANLALTYSYRGKWKQAEELEGEVIEAMKRVLGEEHPDTLTSMGNLALRYRSQGRWKEAEELEVLVMTKRKSVLGVDHPDTLTGIGNLALTYWEQGRWKEAEELEVNILAERRRLLGEQHPDTLMSMGNLALTYRSQGRWEKAEELEEMVMSARRIVFGEEHPDTLTSMGNLASTYRVQGRWKDAEDLEATVMSKRRSMLGEEHLDTLTAMSNLASTFRCQGRWKEAENLEVLVLSKREIVLGKEHAETLRGTHHLALTYHGQGRWAEAERLGVEVMEMMKRVLGEKHPSTLASICSLASTYSKQERWKEAEELQVRVVDMRKDVLGLKHPATLASMCDLAVTYAGQRRWLEAEALQAKALQGSQESYGLQHPHTRAAADFLAQVQRESIQVSADHLAQLETMRIGRWKNGERVALPMISWSLGPWTSNASIPETQAALDKVPIHADIQARHLEETTLHETVLHNILSLLPPEPVEVDRIAAQAMLDAIVWSLQPSKTTASMPVVASAPWLFAQVSPCMLCNEVVVKYGTERQGERAGKRGGVVAGKFIWSLISSAPATCSSWPHQQPLGLGIDLAHVHYALLWWIL